MYYIVLRTVSRTTNNVVLASTTRRYASSGAERGPGEVLKHELRGEIVENSV